MRGWKLACLIIFAAAAFLACLGRRDIATSHEARVAETAREMADTGWPWSARKVSVPPVALTDIHGMMRLTPDLGAQPIAVNTWIVPLLNGEIRLQKPPLPYWCSAVLFHLFGFSEATARLTPALLGALGTIFFYDLVRIFSGRWKARLGAIVWITTLFIPEEFRKTMADPYLAFFTLLCIWAWIKAAKITDEKQSARAASGNSLLYVAIFYGSLGFGLLAKGPPLVLHIGIALAAFHYCYRWPIPRRIGDHLLGIVILLIVALPWPIYVVHHIPNAISLWRYESVGELSDNVENARKWYFYAPNVFFITLPWTIAWIAGFVVALSRKPSDISSPRVRAIRRRRLFPIIWLVATVIFFSFVNLKKNPYLLPALPAQTLVIVEGLAAALAIARRATSFTCGGAVLALQSAIGVAGCIFVLAASYFIDARIPRAMFFFPIAALAVCCWTIVVLQFRKPMVWLWWQALGYVLLALAVMLALETTIDNARSAKSLCIELQGRLNDPDTAVLRSRLPEEVAVYLPLKEQNGMARHVLVIVDDQVGVHDRRKTHLPAVVPPPSNFDSSFTNGWVSLVNRVPMQSQPGDARWKVFELTVERMKYAAR
jgi:4-amino-4-deoxy-L-arabinose transferase-like glycosyltransferase